MIRLGKCKWEYWSAIYIHVGCIIRPLSIDFDGLEKHFRYCPYCGRKIKFVRGEQK